jgi:hypothetical protein
MPEFTFSLIPVADAMAAGAVVVRPGSGGYTITVIARGLPANSQHAVHLHAGQCPSAGFHLRVLGSLTASAAGTGQLASFVPGRYVGNGLFVIVYAGPLPGALGACANLAGMA